MDWWSRKILAWRLSNTMDVQFCWESWAAPKGKNAKLDHNAAMTGDDLRNFVNHRLFPDL
jgi:type I restriction enzyme M protein